MKDDSVFLRHILDAVYHIKEYLEEIEYEDFILIQDGVIKQLKVIGEANKESLSSTKGERFTYSLAGYCWYEG